MPTTAVRTTQKRQGARRRLRPGDLRAMGLRREPGSARTPASIAPTLRVGLVGSAVNTNAPGGGEIQLLETLRALEQLELASKPAAGVLAGLSSSAKFEHTLLDKLAAAPDVEPSITARLWQPECDRLDDIDCLHLFGSHPEWLSLAEAARRAGKRVAISPIAWFDLASRWHESAPLTARLRGALGQLVRTVCPRLPSWRRRLYGAADILLPNSQAEAAQLVRYFGIPRQRIHVVPNGADPELASASPDRFAQRVGSAGFVLCAGRIEPRKNQLALVQALAEHHRMLVVLGDVVPGHEDYAAACRRAASRNVRFVPAIGHDDPLLASALAACGCLVLPSWFETPGLVAIEAAMSGKPLVLTERGAAREYFGPLASYVAPNDRTGIRQAVTRALAAGPNPVLAEMTRQRYTWHAAAQATREAYATFI